MMSHGNEKAASGDSPNVSTSRDALIIMVTEPSMDRAWTGSTAGSQGSTKAIKSLAPHLSPQGDPLLRHLQTGPPWATCSCRNPRVRPGSSTFYVIFSITSLFRDTVSGLCSQEIPNLVISTAHPPSNPVFHPPPIAISPNSQHTARRWEHGCGF